VADDRCDLLCLDLPQAETLRAARLAPRVAHAAARRARALADPTRLTIAAALAGAETEELCVCDLSWIAERSEQLVGHHLRVLHRAGLVSPRREGKMVLYRLTGEGQALLGLVLAPERTSGA
jgi:ArsR family transcriptional regulator, lead/cadmium/zinc/bismuth-responsive transcriptional repressor